MASNYNFRSRAAEVLVENGAARPIRRRETYEDLVHSKARRMDHAPASAVRCCSLSRRTSPRGTRRAADSSHAR